MMALPIIHAHTKVLGVLKVFLTMVLFSSAFITKCFVSIYIFIPLFLNGLNVLVIGFVILSMLLDGFLNYESDV